MSNPSDFIIENGVLKKYIGPGGDVVIPEGVARIAGGNFSGAFYRCWGLTGVTIPEGVKEIGYGAFRGCENLKRVTFPESLSVIDSGSFYECSGLTKLVIPCETAEVRNMAFAYCKSLQCVEFRSVATKISQSAFEGCRDLRILLPDDAVKTDKKLQPILAAACRTLAAEDLAWVLLYQAAKAWREEAAGAAKAGDPCEVFKKQLAIIDNLAKLPSALASNALDTCAVLSDSLTAELVKNFAALLQEKKCSKQLAAMEADLLLREKLHGGEDTAKSINPAENAVMELLAKEKRSPKEVTDRFRELSALKDKEIPQLLDVNDNPCSPVVLAWLLTAHEELRKMNGSNAIVVPIMKGAELKPEARELIKLLDDKSFQSALLELTDQIAAAGGINKRANLLYAICRYASEKTMGQICSRSKKMSRHSQSILDQAVCCSDTRAAILFADKQKLLDRYAAMRNIDANTLRDKVLADFGLNPDGMKRFDLGSGTLTVKLQSDLSLVLIDDNSGKVVKSVPKKAADPERYQQVKDEVDEIKNGVKKVAKGRSEYLFQAFLNGREITALNWRDTYLGNPVFRSVAKLLVWEQSGKTFTLADRGAIDSGEQPYSVTDAPIRVAHPMEMKADELIAWQKYLTHMGLKQPFQQIWEPVISADTVTERRYAGCMLPYYRFIGQEKHGIKVADYDFHNEIRISFEGCRTVVDRIDCRQHEIQMEDRFEVTNFLFSEYTRQVNHIVALLDKWTTEDRVKKDDASVMELMGRFTLAQMMGFIQLAQKAQAFNVLALLLEYKNAHYADFDAMDEFTLE